MSPVRILIVDDHTMVREGVHHVLADVDGFEVIGEAATGREALQAIERLQPDVVLLDLSMPDLDGHEVLRRTRDVSLETRVVVLSMHGDTASIASALEAGALGYLLKDEAGPSEIREAVRAAAAGERSFSADVTEALAEAVQSPAAGPSRSLESLTPRERDVLEGIAEGLSNKQIAARLDIGRRTVESHRQSLMSKLEIRSVAGLTRFAIEVGLISLEDA